MVAKPEFSSDDVMALLDKDPDDLVQQLNITKHDIEELREYEKLLREVLGQKCLDQPDLILRTSYGTVKYSAKQPTRTWDRERISQYLYSRAVDGGDFVGDDGGVRGSAEQRVFDLFRRVFRFETKIGEVKKLDIDVDEFSSVQGEKQADVRFIVEEA